MTKYQAKVELFALKAAMKTDLEDYGQSIGDYIDSQHDEIIKAIDVLCQDEVHADTKEKKKSRIMKRVKKRHMCHGDYDGRRKRCSTCEEKTSCIETTNFWKSCKTKKTFNPSKEEIARDCHSEADEGPYGIIV